MRPPRPLEHCALCDEATGHAGAGEDSRFCLLTEEGPYCDQCDEIRTAGMVEALRDELRRGCPHKCADDACPFYRRINAKLAELGSEDG